MDPSQQVVIDVVDNAQTSIGQLVCDQDFARPFSHHESPLLSNSSLAIMVDIAEWSLIRRIAKLLEEFLTGKRETRLVVAGSNMKLG